MGKVRFMERSTPQAEREFKLSTKKIFEFVHQILERALKPNYPELAFKLYMTAAQTANVAGYRGISYEFLTQASVLWNPSGEVSSMPVSVKPTLRTCLCTWNCSTRISTILVRTMTILR